MTIIVIGIGLLNVSDRLRTYLVYVSDIITMASVSKSRLNIMKSCSLEKEFKGKYNRTNNTLSCISMANTYIRRVTVV